MGNATLLRLAFLEKHHPKFLVGKIYFCDVTTSYQQRPTMFWWSEIYRHPPLYRNTVSSVSQPIRSSWNVRDDSAEIFFQFFSAGGHRG